MKERILLSSIALCFAVLGAVAQRSYTFNAAALNVDGLPEKVSFVTVNEGAPGAAGATILCNAIANSGWSFCGFSEDFNYHAELTAAPASNYYNFGVHGGTVSGLSNSTDGLGFACAKHLTMEGGTRIAWSTHYGETSDGADGLINKGFRVYTVTLAADVAVDVYVLHMDASDGVEDIAARESQLAQLAAYIKNNHNNRPVIILGDTNCRYTREQLEAKFIDVINADSRFTIKDAWVEHMWGGIYPAYGSDAMMTHAYGDQKGEVVDKIFYINTTESNLTLKALSYLHDTSVNVSDHYPVVVSFVLTDPNGTPLTEAEKEANWTLEGEDSGNKKPTWEGEQVVSGTTYYMMNVGTGEYIKWGGAYYTEAVAGYGGTPITPITSDGGNSWVLKTSRNHVGEGDDTYLDQTGTWFLEPVEGTAYQYRIRSSRNLYLSTTPSETHRPIRSVAGNANDDNQKWVFLTDDRIRTEMTKATSEYPFNFTALLKSADFDVIEFEDGWTDNWTGFNQSNGTFKAVGDGWGGDPNAYVTYAYANSTSATTMSQNLGTLPNGTYNISFEGFYRSRYKPSGIFQSEKDETRDAAVIFGSAKIAVPQNTSTSIGAGADVVGPLFKNDTYLKSQQITLASSESITLSVTKPATSSSAKGAWICVDNFHLVYYGAGETAIDPNKEYKDQVLAKVNETYAKVMELNEAGQAVYDITTVVSRYNNAQITSAADAKALCSVVDAAYASAYAAHRAYIVEDAFNNMGADGDVSVVILNPSFEEGLTGWSIAQNGWDTGVKKNEGNVAASNGDGDYLFNTWSGDQYDCGIIYQDIRGLRNGYYKLSAVVASWAEKQVYLVGNKQYAGIATTAGEGQFVEHELLFLVENGSAQIGAVADNNGRFYYKKGTFFKVDNFRLAYKGSVGEGRVKIALADAKAKAEGLNEVAKAEFYNAVAQYENAAIAGDGKAEETAIYNALKAATATQPHAGTDMTWLITNPSFETGDWTGWATVYGWDTKVAHATDGVAPGNGHGYYVVNTWNDDSNATNSGVNAPIYQALSGLPNGRYRLSVDVASDDGNQICVYATVDGQTVNGAASPANNWTFTNASVEFTVANGAATIGVVGYKDETFNIGGGCWYKCDNFRLTYLGNELTLSEEATELPVMDWYTTVDVDLTIEASTWNTFVAPFDMDIPEGWEVATLVESKLKDGVVTLTFDAADGIKAGVPYMIRIEDGVSGTQVNNVTINTQLTVVETEHVKFVGTYICGAVPEKVFFMNAEAFTQAEKGDVVKAYRAYVQSENEEIHAVAYRFVGDPIAVEEVVLNQSSAALVEGETLTLAATVSPEDATDKTVVWSSGDVEVAVVDENGQITAVAPGTATITATAGECSATCEVTVIAASYEFTLLVEGEVFFKDTLARGTLMDAVMESVTAPTKEGYTFSGWDGIPETMPAGDLTIDATFVVNTYKVYYYVGEELVHTAEVNYGEAIPEYIYEPAEGYVFVGWVGEEYEAMPAHDVVYTANLVNGINHSSVDSQSAIIYDIWGRRVEQAVRGVYIINGKKVILK